MGWEKRERREEERRRERSNEERAREERERGERRERRERTMREMKRGGQEKGGRKGGRACNEEETKFQRVPPPLWSMTWSRRALPAVASPQSSSLLHLGVHLR